MAKNNCKKELGKKWNVSSYYHAKPYIDFAQQAGVFSKNLLHGWAGTQVGNAVSRACAAPLPETRGGVTSV